VGGQRYQSWVGLEMTPFQADACCKHPVGGDSTIGQRASVIHVSEIVGHMVVRVEPWNKTRG